MRHPRVLAGTSDGGAHIKFTVGGHGEIIFSDGATTDAVPGRIIGNAGASMDDVLAAPAQLAAE